MSSIQFHLGLTRSEKIEVIYWPKFIQNFLFHPFEICFVEFVDQLGDRHRSKILWGTHRKGPSIKSLQQIILKHSQELHYKNLSINKLNIIHTHPSIEFFDTTHSLLGPVGDSDIQVAKVLKNFFTVDTSILALCPSGLGYKYDA